MKKFITLCLIASFINVTDMMAQATSNTFTYRVGNAEITLLSEGQQKGNPNILIGATPEMLKRTMPDGTYPSAVNAFLVKMDGKNYLIDTGFGRNLKVNLKSANVTSEDITTVIITHMHGDHIGGMLIDDRKAFPNANVIIGDVEKNYWTSDVEKNKLPAGRQGNFMSARKVIDVYKNNLNVVSAEEIGKKTADGIYFIKAYGHTPGHMGCLIRSAGKELLIWADLAHVMALQMPYPQIAVTYDVIPEMAIESRKVILKYVADKNIPVAGMHVPYPGIGKVEALPEGGYKFIPADK